MEEKITIIEGPPPTFEAVTDGWVLGLSESPTLADIAVTQLRTFNGPAMVERCYRAWNNRQSIILEYRTPEGLEHQAPIVAARFTELDDGHLLLLWIRLTDDTVELELGYDDDIGDDEDLDFPDLL
ncbi:MAG: hypothetical protein KAS38_08465 [Anaerolineales bacterium]|nr:hypothetical protein [Anaerolineales bacterium]MCK4976924.1 hypothetical protein [Anaerolineales bacterium]